MIRLEEKVQIDYKENKSVFLNASNAQLKSKGIRNTLVTVDNIITDVSLSDIYGSISGNITVYLKGTIGEKSFIFPLSKQEYLDLVNKINVIDGVFDASFVIYYTGLTANFIVKDSEKHKELKAKVKSEESLRPKQVEFEKEKAKLEKEYTKKIFSEIPSGSIVKLNDKVLAIYIGHDYFSYTKLVKKKRQLFSKKGYAFFIIKKLEDANNPKKYQKAILQSVSKIQVLGRVVDLNKVFNNAETYLTGDSIYNLKQKIFSLTNDIPFSNSNWAKPRALSLLSENVLFYLSKSETKDYSLKIVTNFDEKVKPGEDVSRKNFNEAFWVSFNI